MRGKHAHLTLHQYVIAVAGSFDIVLDDGKKRWRQHLNRADEAFYLPPMVWHELDNFSAGSICMVLASDVYDESDYLRDYEDFRMVLKARELDEQHQDAVPRIAQTRISASADGGVAGMPLVQPASLTTASVQPDNRPPRHFTDSLA